MEQIFFNLTQKLKQKKDKIFIIKAEFRTLDKALKNELFFIDNDKILLSPFLGSLISLKRIQSMTEYIWILDKQRIESLKSKLKNVFIYSPLFHFELSNKETVQFKIGLKNDSSDRYMLFKLYILNSSKSVDGKFSICIDEIEYVDNAWSFNAKSSGQSETLFSFEQRYLHQLTGSLTLKIA